MRVLLIEDDFRLAPLIKQVLEDENMRVEIANDGNLGLELGLTGEFDVAIVDWMLPGKDGPSICREWRTANIPIGILMLTARGQIEDKVAGLNMGADDYLVKPFSFDELIARVEAVGRRHNLNPIISGELRVGQIVLDIKTHSARRGNATFELTKREWGILEYMLRHPNQVLTRENILDYVWPRDKQVQTTMVDVYISYLRNKLSQPRMPDPIETVRGIGYKLIEKDA